MNVLGHTHAAAARRPGDLRFVLGAVLPDLASMAGVRLDDRARRGTLGEGIRCHYAVDRAFHAAEAFRLGVAALRADLLAAGLATGPARAVAHAGWELLLDGTLVGTATEETYRAALVHGPEAGAAVRPDHRERWLTVTRQWGAPPPLRYDDAGWVAERLHGMLERRPRLRFAATEVGSVAAVLDRHADRVRSAAPGVLAVSSPAPDAT